MSSTHHRVVWFVIAMSCLAMSCRKPTTKDADAGPASTVTSVSSSSSSKVASSASSASGTGGRAYLACTSLAWDAAGKTADAITVTGFVRMRHRTSASGASGYIAIEPDKPVCGPDGRKIEELDIEDVVETDRYARRSVTIHGVPHRQKDGATAIKVDKITLAAE